MTLNTRIIALACIATSLPFLASSRAVHASGGRAPQITCPDKSQTHGKQQQIIVCGQPDPTDPPDPTLPPSTPAPPSAPTAVAATQDQMNAFLALAPAPPPSGSWQLDEYAVAGQWALVGYYNTYAGETALLQQNGSSWTVIDMTGGQISALRLQQLAPSMPSSTAQSLYNLAVSQDQ